MKTLVDRSNLQGKVVHIVYDGSDPSDTSIFIHDVTSICSKGDIIIINIEDVPVEIISHGFRGRISIISKTEYQVILEEQKKRGETKNVTELDFFHFIHYG